MLIPGWKTHCFLHGYSLFDTEACWNDYSKLSFLISLLIPANATSTLLHQHSRTYFNLDVTLWQQSLCTLAKPIIRDDTQSLMYNTRVSPWTKPIQKLKWASFAISLASLGVQLFKPQELHFTRHHMGFERARCPAWLRPHLIKSTLKFVKLKLK